MVSAFTAILLISDPLKRLSARDLLGVLKYKEKAQEMMKMRTMVAISSTGGAAQYNGGVLGQYEYNKIR